MPAERRPFGPLFGQLGKIVLGSELYCLLGYCAPTHRSGSSRSCGRRETGSSRPRWEGEDGRVGRSDGGEGGGRPSSSLTKICGLETTVYFKEMVKKQSIAEIITKSGIVHPITLFSPPGGQKMGNLWSHRRSESRKRWTRNQRAWDWRMAKVRWQANKTGPLLLEKSRGYMNHPLMGGAPTGGEETASCPFPGGRLPPGYRLPGDRWPACKTSSPLWALRPR